MGKVGGGVAVHCDEERRGAPCAAPAQQLIVIAVDAPAYLDLTCCRTTSDAMPQTLWCLGASRHICHCQLSYVHTLHCMRRIHPAATSSESILDIS